MRTKICRPIVRRRLSRLADAAARSMMARCGPPQLPSYREWACPENGAEGTDGDLLVGRLAGHGALSRRGAARSCSRRPEGNARRDEAAGAGNRLAWISQRACEALSAVRPRRGRAMPSWRVDPAAQCAERQVGHAVGARGRCFPARIDGVPVCAHRGWKRSRGAFRCRAWGVRLLVIPDSVRAHRGRNAFLALSAQASSIWGAGAFSTLALSKPCDLAGRVAAPSCRRARVLRRQRATVRFCARVAATCSPTRDRLSCSWPSPYHGTHRSGLRVIERFGPAAFAAGCRASLVWLSCPATTLTRVDCERGGTTPCGCWPARSAGAPRACGARLVRLAGPRAVGTRRMLVCTSYDAGARWGGAGSPGRRTPTIGCRARGYATAAARARRASLARAEQSAVAQAPLAGGQEDFDPQAPTRPPPGGRAGAAAFGEGTPARCAWACARFRMRPRRSWLTDTVRVIGRDNACSRHTAPCAPGRP